MTTLNNRFIEIGRIGRAHGLEGIVRFVPNNLFPVDLFDHTQILYMRNIRSDLVPLRIESVRKERKKNQLSFFVKFDMIANRNEAGKVLDRPLFVEKEKLTSSGDRPPEETPSLIGYRVRFENREIGHILDEIENPAHLIIEIKIKTAGSLLVPFVDEYIEKTDHTKKMLYCRNLEQIMDS